MKAFITLVRREYWENRHLVFTLPGALAVFLAVVAALFAFYAYFLGDAHRIAVWPAASHHFTGLVSFLIFTAASPFALLLWIVVLYYFAQCLYNDRKDGSILFWKSLPVSEAQSIAAKLFFGLILAPVLTWIFVLFTESVVLLIARLVLPGIGAGALVNVLYQPGEILLSWLGLLWVMLLQVLWLLPIFAWFVFCSAFARRAPLLYATLILLIVVVLTRASHMLWQIPGFLMQRLTYINSLWAQFPHLFTPKGAARFELRNLFMPASMSVYDYGLGLLIGLAVALIFLSLAGWLRGRNYAVDK